MSKTVLETERLRLREMDMHDQNDLLQLFQDPMVMKYYPQQKNFEETIRWITWNKNNYRKFHVGLWIVEDKATDQFLGQCGLVPKKVEGVVQMEIGYLFVRKQWGNGYATEAAQACVDYSFRTLQVPTLIVLIDPLNQRSIQVAKKIGMHYEKTVKKWGGDQYIYSMVNPNG
ncbi:GNAT family N-acetyltransferase [Aquibacillus sediminis]|uniref:GNAT family N-acetyltransferase n=1 Tax=Aquibacillus sediminis TaxID=2574734 RepID=UPI001109A16B|nr:GNAT family N-acetyltransferase [Aquibacillus sediminis]